MVMVAALYVLKNGPYFGLQQLRKRQTWPLIRKESRERRLARRSRDCGSAASPASRHWYGIDSERSSTTSSLSSAPAPCFLVVQTGTPE